VTDVWYRHRAAGTFGTQSLTTAPTVMLDATATTGLQLKPSAIK